MNVLKRLSVFLGTVTFTLMTSVTIAATPVAPSSVAVPTTAAPAVSQPANANPATPAAANPMTDKPASVATKPAGDTKSAAQGNDKKPQMVEKKAEKGVPVGRVVWVKGKMFAERPNKTQRELKKDSVIFLHDLLITDDKSQAQVIFSDNGLMTFRTNTKFMIEEYEYDPNKKVEQGKSSGKFVMNLVQGGFRTVTGLISKGNPKDYKVKTPVATIGVRGTQFTILYVPPSVTKKVKKAVKEASGNLVVELEKGEICLTDSKGNTSCLDLSKRFAEFIGGAKDVKFFKEKPKELRAEKLPIFNVEFTPFSGSDSSINTGDIPTGDSGSSGGSDSGASDSGSSDSGDSGSSGSSDSGDSGSSGAADSGDSGASGASDSGGSTDTSGGSTGDSGTTTIEGTGGSGATGDSTGGSQGFCISSLSF